MDENLKRELLKILDALKAADKHFSAEAEMNAALHLAIDVRPAPLASKVKIAAEELEKLLGGQDG